MRHSAEITAARSLGSRLLGLLLLSAEAGLPMLLCAALGTIAGGVAGFEPVGIVASALGGAVSGVGLAILLSTPVSILLDVLFGLEIDIDVFAAWRMTFGPERYPTSISLHTKGFIVGDHDRISWQAVTAITETRTSVVLQVARPPLRQIEIDVRAPGAREAVHEALQVAMRAGHLQG